jgi:hypothetical protein
MTVFGAVEERPHDIGSEPSWNEAYSFDLYDSREGLSCFTGIGVRPHQGAMEVGLHFVLPDGGLIAARHVRSVQTNPADLDVGDVRYDIVEPLARWRVSYDGPAHSLPSARDAMRPEAWRKSRVERLIVDLEFEATSPVLGRPGLLRQAGRWAGTVWVSGDEYRVEGRGQRSRTWGAADWEVLRKGRTFSVCFADAAIAATLGELDGSELHEGWIHRADRCVGIRRIEVTTETEPGSYLQKAFRLVLTDDGGTRHEVSGEVLHVVPLPSARSGRDRQTCVSVARFTSGDSVGHGFATYLHEVDASGWPLEPVE